MSAEFWTSLLCLYHHHHHHHHSVSRAWVCNWISLHACRRGLLSSRVVA